MQVIQKILGFFGYVKIPKAAILLSIEQEIFLEKIQKLENDQKGKEIFENYLEMQRALTQFLRSGQLISG